MATNTQTYESAATGFRDAVRVQEAITAPLERKALAWLARRTPEWIGPDHLTALGFAAQFLAGALLRGWRAGASSDCSERRFLLR